MMLWARAGPASFFDTCVGAFAPFILLVIEIVDLEVEALSHCSKHGI